MQKILLYENGRCTWSSGKGNNADCLRAASRITREYSIDNSQYNHIVSAAFKLAREATETIQFYTFTFANDPDEKSANRSICKFFKEFNREREVKYVWTKERQKNGKIHFHALLDSGYVPAKDLQNMWNRSILFACGNVPISNNSFRLPPKANREIFRNRDIISIAKYIAKYISKERSKSFEQPVFQICKRLYPISREISLSEYEALVDTFGIFSSKVYEFCAVIQLNNAENYR